MRRYILLLMPLLAAWNPLDRPNRAVENGNAQMSAGKADAALVDYDKAVAAMPNEPAAHFNRGTALHALSRYDEAITEFMRATEAREPGLKATAFYNLGNSYFQANRYADAIAAYKRSLALNPSDVRAKWNLELALQKKKEEDKKKQEDQKNKQDQNKDDKKDQQKQDQNKDDKKDDQNKDDKKDDQKQDDKQDQQKQDAGSPPKPQSPDAGAQPPQPQPSAQPQDDKTSDMNEVDAVLDNLERSPKDLEKMRARLRAVRRAPPAKDW
jgi:Ca-activated chloride channel family protein